jgi:hypothetical protein
LHIVAALAVDPEIEASLLDRGPPTLRPVTACTSLAMTKLTTADHSKTTMRPVS